MAAESIVLGTAQFGTQYGIANRIGQPPKKDVFSILEFAGRQGIDTLDTAYSYGESEEIIGEFISQSGKIFNIISKTEYLDLKREDSSAIDRYLCETLARLKQNKIYGYLVHEFAYMFKCKGLWDRLQSLKKEGLIEKIGFSLDTIEELEHLLNNNIHFDIVQIPYNVFDQRFERYFQVLKKIHVELYARSVFLQGLFFLEMGEIVENFRSAENIISKMREISASLNIPIYSLCLNFVLLNPYVDKVIIGVDSIEQLKQNIDSMRQLEKVKSIYRSLKSLECRDEKIIFPYKWK